MFGAKKVEMSAFVDRTVDHLYKNKICESRELQVIKGKWLETQHRFKEAYRAFKESKNSKVMVHFIDRTIQRIDRELNMAQEGKNRVISEILDRFYNVKQNSENKIRVSSDCDDKEFPLK